MNQPARSLTPLLDAKSAKAAMERIAQNLSSVVKGKRTQVELAVTSIVARGHLLLEDVPGVGKTTLAEAMARSFNLSFARVQFTADLLPSDILGAQIYSPQNGTFSFRKGPLFHQLVLADELNRAPPRTQSALLEAMAQQQVSMDGVTHPLPEPFAVVATQNPADFSGTYPLPDSQLDRFLMRVSLGHPGKEIEAELLRTRKVADPLRSLEPVSSPEELASLQKCAAEVNVDEAVAAYVVELAHASRTHADVERGASTRGVLALMSAAKTYALWNERDFVTPHDVRTVLAPVLAHRLLLRSAASGTFSREEAGHLLEEIARKLPAPK
ncbi:MAG: AAA family ATPase [Myxococcaceae bacterium]